jgi:hypothetical protein
MIKIQRSYRPNDQASAVSKSPGPRRSPRFQSMLDSKFYLFSVKRHLGFPPFLSQRHGQIRG